MVQRPFLLVQFSRPLRFPSCSPLTRCSISLLCKSSRFQGAGREKLVDIPQLRSSYPCLDKVVHTPVVCNDRCADGSDARKLRKFRSCSTFERGRCPVMQVLRGAAGAVPVVTDVPVIMQRRCSREQWKCHRFSSSPELVDIFVRNRDGHVFNEGWR